MPILEEVREAVFSIDPDSVAGPDGFGTVFFHTCWDIISGDVFGAVTEFFHGVDMPKSFTATTISLIPKTASLACWSEYRPISLCNVTKKICTKLMTIGLGRGFVPGRLLSDNVLRQKGFPQCWIGLVANVVSHYWFSVLVNDEHAGFFHSTCSLRQGDPLSLALFVLSADYLSWGLDRLFVAHPTMYYQAPGQIRVSHLAYEDDLMIFTTTCRQNMELLRDFLQAYERVSGQLINGMKSSFIVGRQGWAMTNLSHRGRLALIRSVLQATSLHLLQHDNWLGEKPLAQLLHRDAYTMEPQVKGIRLCGWGPVRGLSRQNRPGRLFDMPHLGGSYWQMSGTVPCSQQFQFSCSGFFKIEFQWMRGYNKRDSGFRLNISVVREPHSYGALLVQNAAKYHRVQFSTNGIILEVQRHLRTLSLSPQCRHWSAPSLSWFKLNTDDSSLGKPGLAGAAGIIRDSARHGLELALAHGLAPLVVEVDATMLLVADIQHIFKEVNGAADHLAKEAASLQLTLVLRHDDITGVLRGII
ncbi:UNVERIFIED_CONTAM: hypothetical protein Scaly_0080300 [Sesamum calycinum]|uniref:Reverse transcriptase domain-containing protein n=1 Tax=Sesamum calycinum TaxID=2727403 RepID=A0AAW2SW48_9LAMI